MDDILYSLLLLSNEDLRSLKRLARKELLFPTKNYTPGAIQDILTAGDKHELIGGAIHENAHFHGGELKDAISGLLSTLSLGRSISNFHNVKVDSNFNDNDKKMVKFADQSYKPDRLKELEGYKLDEDLSDKENAVYSNNKDVILSYRGTCISCPWKTVANDVGSDAYIVGGQTKESPRFDRASKKFQQVYDKYKRPITLSASSLGGTQNIHTVQKFGNKVKHAYSYNPGFSPLSGELSPNQSRSTYYITGGDPVSNTLLTRNLDKSRVVYQPAKSWFAPWENHLLDKTWLDKPKTGGEIVGGFPRPDYPGQPFPSPKRKKHISKEYSN